MYSTFKTISLAAALAVGGALAASAATVSVQSNAPTSWGAVDRTKTLETGSGTWTTKPSVVSGSVEKKYRSPFDPQGTGATGLQDWESIKYYTVGSGEGFVPSPAVLTYSGTHTMLSILWGSIDTYNAIDFYLAGAQVDTVTGADLVPPGKSVVGASFVKITGVVFDQLFFRADQDTASGNDQAAFEFASVSAVPVPAGGLLLLTALGGIAALRRRKKD